MIKINFVRNHKSIKALKTIDLPDFTILTGLNGSGKSHLLEAIENGSVQLRTDLNINIDQRPQFGNIKRYDWNTLLLNTGGTVDPATVLNARNSQWAQLENHIRQPKQNLLNNAKSLELPENNKKLCGIYLKNKHLTQEDPANPEQNKIFHFNNFVNQNSANFINQYSQNNPQLRNFIEKLQDKIQCPIIFLTKSQFFDHCAVCWSATDIFTQSFEVLFTAYEKNRVDNEFNEWRQSIGREYEPYHSPKKYQEKYGIPPWKIVDGILKRVTPKYKINKPDGIKGLPYHAHLINKKTGDEIDFSNLSSGERILISFAHCLYNSSDENQFTSHPKVLLFDEIDAPLHPSMTKSMLDIIKDVLIDKFNTKVILTTHSPSTVAMAPEGSIFTIEGETKKRIKKVSKDAALSLLTHGVPSLSVSHQNRRQVFVESNHDVSFYEKITEKLGHQIDPEISLNFIASGKNGDGNCDQVRAIVNKLSRAGTDTVRGIIDWDKKNNGNDFIKVLGKNQRYSIENYIFDPILLAMYLLREKYIKKSDVNLNENENHTHLIGFTNDRLQKIANWILAKIKVHIDHSNNIDISTKCNYVGKRWIEIPNWFLHGKGHLLEEAIKNAFPNLKNEKYRGEEKSLKAAIQNKVIDDHHEFISSDLLDLLLDLQRDVI